MLKKELRLPAGLRLTRFAAYRSQSFKLLASENGLTHCRCGFIISKKIDKRAVVRNRSKRLLRSCVEEIMGKLNGKYDMLFIIQKNLTDKTHDDIMSEVVSVLQKARLII